MLFIKIIKGAVLNLQGCKTVLCYKQYTKKEFVYQIYSQSQGGLNNNKNLHFIMSKRFLFHQKVQFFKSSRG